MPKLEYVVSQQKKFAMIFPCLKCCLRLGACRFIPTTCVIRISDRSPSPRLSANHASNWNKLSQNRPESTRKSSGRATEALAGNRTTMLNSPGSPSVADQYDSEPVPGGSGELGSIELC